MNPDELNSVFAVVRSLQGSPLAAQMQRHLLANPAMAALVESNWRPAPIDLETLSALPEGSLGRTYADQLKSLGLTPESLIDPQPITSPADYITYRPRETHDIIHVLTGFGTPLKPPLRVLAHGFQLGLAAECLITFKLEEGWVRPLSEWRQELGLPETPLA
jgi:ubiquinone biosynthesis protein COQ4